jgi:hypothetical protein
MSFWMELMCDVRKDGIDPANILRNRCYTHNNDNVTGHAMNTKVSVLAYRGILEHNAVRQGWTKINGNWVCPGCKD